MLPPLTALRTGSHNVARIVTFPRLISVKISPIVNTRAHGERADCGDHLVDYITGAGPRILTQCRADFPAS